MTLHRILTSVLALAAGMVPLSASTVYCSTCGFGDDETAFTNATLSLFFPNAPITFTGTGINADESVYVDSVSGVEFSYFKSNGTSPDSNSLAVTGLKTLIDNAGDLIEVTLPTGVFAFAAHMTSSDPNASFCIEENTFVKNLCNPFTPGSGTEFVGLDSTSPLTTVWIGYNNASPAITLSDFEIGEQQAMSDTPEAATFLMLGTGLTSLGLLRRKLRKKS